MLCFHVVYVIGENVSVESTQDCLSQLSEKVKITQPG